MIHVCFSRVSYLPSLKIQQILYMCVCVYVCMCTLYRVPVVCTGLAKKFIWVFPQYLTEKPEQTFGQPNISLYPLTLTHK